jgi:Tol biopolymer transport system component
MRRIAFFAMLIALLGIVTVAPSNATALGSEGKIAFVRSNQIYTMTRTGTSVTKLTTVGKNYRPKWSPNGQKIAYINEDASGRRDVFIMSATGTNKTKVTNSGSVNTAPAWSPNGATLAFAQTGTYRFTPTCYPNCADQIPYDVNGNYLFIVKATAPFGTPSLLKVYPSYLSSYYDSKPITVYDKSSLAWSPNGADLALVNGDSGDSPDTGLHMVRGMASATAATIANTAHPDDIINGTGGDCCGYELWSDLNYIPNGVFGYSVLDRGNELEYELNPRATLRYPGFVSQLGDKTGAPSPNGKNMVFVRTTGTTPNIWTATIKGAQRKQIQANGYQPDWQPLP